MAHVAILHALVAHLNLVWVGEGVIHPLVLEAAGGRVLHRLVAHVFEGRRQHREDLLGLGEGLVVWRHAWALVLVD